MCKIIATSTLCLVVMALSGCGGDLASVTGTVLYQGAQVKAGSVTFAPISNGTSQPGKPASGSIAGDGSLTVIGATPGRNRITFAPALSTQPVALKPGQSVRAAYEGLTPKVVEVELKPGSNTINIDLVRAQNLPR